MKDSKSVFFRNKVRLGVGSAVILAVVFTLFFAGCRQKDSEQFVIIAHRGASHAAPENTLAAFKKAIEFGSDYAELDVCQTKDGEIVLMHDDTLKRTTNGTGKIWTFTLKELKQLDAGSWFGEEFKGEPIPTLLEVIQCVKGKMKLNIEVKVSRDEPEIARKIVDIIRAEAFEKECIVTSFDRKIVEKVKKIAPDIKTGFIFNREYPPDVFEGNWEALCCNYRIVNKEFVLKAKNSHKIIYVWTVNRKEEMRRLIDLKVDGIITNVPDLLKEVVMN